MIFIYTFLSLAYKSFIICVEWFHSINQIEERTMYVIQREMTVNFTARTKALYNVVDVADMTVPTKHIYYLSEKDAKPRICYDSD